MLLEFGWVYGAQAARRGRFLRTVDPQRQLQDAPFGARWQLRSHPGGFGGRDSVAIRARFDAIRIAFTRFGL